MIRIFSLLLVGLFLSSCGSTRSFYMLTPDGPPPTGGGQAIGVGPITLPEYIDRANLVIQESEHSLSVAADHRWAGDLSASVSRVTAANLGRRLGTGNVRIYPWQRDDEINKQVTIDIRQMHGGSDGYAVIEATYRVYSLPGRNLKASRTFVDREALAKDGYEPLVAAQSKLLARLADDIARAMR